MKFIDFLRFIRPANIVTAMADVFAGTAIVGYTLVSYKQADVLFALSMLLIATSSLYAGGIIFNDVFDVEADKKNRPERILPSGKLSVHQATLLGVLFFGVAIASAFLVSSVSGLVAICVMVCALLYDRFAKHHNFLGPLFMGFCRGFNLLLGMTILKTLPAVNFLYITIIPVLFIFAVTLTAQKENTGKNKKSLKIAWFLDTLILVAFLAMCINFNFSFFKSFLFLFLWYSINAIAKYKAVKINTPKNIQIAVKTAILSLILLDACYVAGFSGILHATIVVCLLPVSIFLAKQTSVT